jgi:hypothetical protein
VAMAEVSCSSTQATTPISHRPIQRCGAVAPWRRPSSQRRPSCARP